MAYDALPKVGPDEHIDWLCRRYDALKGSTERSNCERHWQEIAELMSPRKIDFLGMRTPGAKRMNQIYDSTGIQANEMLAAGLHGMATNPASKWFSLRLVDNKYRDEASGQVLDLQDNAEVQQWLSDVEDVMWQRIYAPGTNFTTALHESYLDIGAFGTSIMFVGERDDGGLLFESRPLSECVIAENMDGKIDTVMRVFKFSVRQMWQMQNEAGWRVSTAVADMYREGMLDQMIEVVHAVYPRPDREQGRRDVENKAFASCYFEKAEKHQLSMSGFDEMPYLIGRWAKYSSELYGHGPGMVALPDVKMLQQMTLAKIKIIHKAADPPLWLSDDGLVGRTRTVPGGINYWRGNPHQGVMMQPVSLQGLEVLMNDILQLREQILRIYYADLMRMTDRDKMTATEVVQRTQEMMRLFGPLVGRLESEMLGPMVELVFNALERKGLLPEPPAALSEREWTVEYISPIATAQKQAHFQGIVQVMQMIALMGPDVAAKIAMKNLDVDKMFRLLWAGFNNDPDMLTDEESLAQASEMEQMQQGAQVAGQIMGPVQQGADAMAKVSQANQASGAEGQPAFNVQELLARMANQAANDPQTSADMVAAEQAVRDQIGG